jgi:flagellar FliJ protein
MKKFSFSLQKLLNYKEQVLDIERTTLADMNAVLAGFVAELELLGAQRAHRVDEFREKSKTGMAAIEMDVHKNFLTSLDYSVKQKKQQIRLQRAAVDKQQSKVREVKIEISTMEKLRERKLEEYNFKNQKAEEIFIEEFVSYGRFTAPAQQTG